MILVVQPQFCAKKVLAYLKKKKKMFIVLSL